MRLSELVEETVAGLWLIIHPNINNAGSYAEMKYFYKIITLIHHPGTTNNILSSVACHCLVGSDDDKYVMLTLQTTKMIKYL